MADCFWSSESVTDMNFWVYQILENSVRSNEIDEKIEEFLGLDSSAPGGVTWQDTSFFDKIDASVDTIQDKIDEVKEYIQDDITSLKSDVSDLSDMLTLVIKLQIMILSISQHSNLLIQSDISLTHSKKILNEILKKLAEQEES